ncbi:Tetraspanin-19 [Acorus gramineus]|uniref:Tetraspanin-19 n=1 Tax=Acorus gramineus TaxID=55184 RepID=A0AAV9B7Y6_ACOGR|nr:Tetraspanin-19 [Acorus gramineus]
MACRGFWECLLKLLNFLLTLAGLAMIGYGIYLLVEWNKVSPEVGPAAPPSVYGPEVLKLGRPMLVLATLSESFLDKLPKAWYGSVSWTFSSAIPADKTGDFDMIYHFLKENWKIAKWVILGVVILQALAFLLALIVRAANRLAEYDSDDEYIAPRNAVRQPLINRQGIPATGVPVPNFDQRPSRNDAWSTRMREKYGLDTSEFTYNPSDLSRFQQGSIQPAEERGRCTIL